jgi:hypothetical protein
MTLLSILSALNLMLSLVALFAAGYRVSEKNTFGMIVLVVCFANAAFVVPRSLSRLAHDLAPESHAAPAPEAGDVECPTSDSSNGLGSEVTQ